MSKARKTPAGPVRQEHILKALRAEIVGGQFAPGARLPTRVELEKRFGTTSVTIQRAMHRLAGEGFIRADCVTGTFVAAHPPHLTQFALAFPYSPDSIPSQFFRAIRVEADRWQNPERRVLSFYDVESHTDVEDYQRLLRYVQSTRLAGLIFAANPFVLRQMGSPLVATPDLPRVVIEDGMDVGGFPTVYPDLPAFLPKAFDHLVARGCQRVAVVMLAKEDLGADLGQVQATAAKRGLTVKPPWIQAASPATGTWIRQLGHLLVQGAPGERPDGLVITDDNLVPELTAGLVASGIRVRADGEALRPGDLAVVAHTNFPHPTLSAVPVTRLGYDITKLVATCMERIDQQRHGETSPAVTVLPPIFEEERESRDGERGAASGKRRD